MSEIRTSEEIERYAWLLSSDGTELLARISELTASGTPDLRIAEQLRVLWPANRVALVMTQRDLRIRARVKFSRADVLFFTRAGLEQATSDRIAMHRAKRYQRCHRVTDLCCGIGGDLVALAQAPGIASVIAVDRDPVHLMLAAANVATLVPGYPVSMLQADVRDTDLSPYDGLFIDPARRGSSGRLGGITSEPPLEWALALAEAVDAVGIKTAPGIPHHLVPDDWELEMIAVGSDLKEAVLWSPALATGTRTATIIEGDQIHQIRSLPGEAVDVEAPRPGQWLLDPNPAVTRAGLVEDLARQLGTSKIDDDIAFLVADDEVQTPFARALLIIDAMPWHEKHLRRRLRELNAGPVDIRRRGLAGDVDTITKRLRGKGSRRIVIAMTRVGGDPWAILCDIA